MNTPKESLAELVPKLPDDVSFDDIMYRLFILTRLDQARREAEAGDVVEHEEVERLMEQWIIA